MKGKCSPLLLPLFLSPALPRPVSTPTPTPRWQWRAVASSSQRISPVVLVFGHRLSGKCVASPLSSFFRSWGTCRH